MIRCNVQSAERSLRIGLPRSDTRRMIVSVASKWTGDYICILPTGRLGQVRIGGVAPCEHADKKRPGSCEPIRISTSFPRPSFTDLRLHLLRQQRSVLSPFRSGIVQNELPVRV